MENRGHERRKVGIGRKKKKEKKKGKKEGNSKGKLR